MYTIYYKPSNIKSWLYYKTYNNATECIIDARSLYSAGNTVEIYNPLECPVEREPYD